MRPSDSPSPEEQIENLKAQLAQAQKLTALGELVGTTTHEFNNVLMTVINYAKMGLRHKDEATRDKALSKILTASERAAKITNSVLSMARNRSDGFEPTALDRIIEDALVLLEREMRKYRISIEQVFEPTPPVLANGNQIQQVLLNLLINARQAMPDGGRIIIGLKHDRKNGAVDLVVRDTGKGMPPEKLKRIFEPFFSTKQGPDETGKGGTGLGLSACRDIIENHRGRIRVDSSQGKGTAFTIKLPLAPAKKPKPVPAAAPQEPAASSRAAAPPKVAAAPHIAPVAPPTAVPAPNAAARILPSQPITPESASNGIDPPTTAPNPLASH